MRTVVAALALAIILLAASRPVGPLPALGPFLDPVHGVLSIARGIELPDSAQVEIPGVSSPTRVLYDDRDVPHIFATSLEDAVRALGYVVARDRLFQLELQTRATAGTLTELVGEVALDADRSERQLGLAWAADRNFAQLDPASPTHGLLLAYADGVNAWIDNLRTQDLPVEYHLFGVRPQRWRPEHSLYLLKRMGSTLAFINTEQRKRVAAELVGWEAADALFPVNHPIQEPVQVNGLNGPRYEVVPLPPPARDGGETAATRGEWLDPLAALGPTIGGNAIRWPWTGDLESENAISCIELAAAYCPTEDVVGSNNWAAGPIKTANGHALLAGDPHLNLTLPSIWYEAHLVVPGEIDVYGVTIPGTPGVIIGFNRDVAWSFTNTGADVMDFYREQVDDPDDPRRYRLDGEWSSLEVRPETYRDRSGRVLAVDTVYHTHRGPLLRNDDDLFSLRWTVLEDQAEIESFRRAAPAASVDEWLAAMEGYVAPIQNGIVADRNGSIAIRASGRYPIRPDGGRGDHVWDGTTTDSDWEGYWPVERYPFSVDPAQGFLASANQQPIDPRVEPAYIGADWPSPWRAMRINELLRESDEITADDFRRFQTDPGSARVDAFLPTFLRVGERVRDDYPDANFVRAAAARLAEWDGRYTKDNTRAVLFELAMSELSRRTWDELDAIRQDGSTRRVATPASAILATLLSDSTSVWWDDAGTNEVIETRDDVVFASLSAALQRARTQYGTEGDRWRWDRVRHANVYHLLRIPGFSALELPVQGGPSTLSPSSGSGTHGASWRMVVELGDDVTARAVYPGGQSGNPLSPRYRNRIDMWVNGELEPVLFPRDQDDLAGRVTAVLLVRPEP